MIDLNDKIIEITNEIKDNNDELKDTLELLLYLKKDLNNYIKKVKNGTFEIEKNANKFNI